MSVKKNFFYSSILTVANYLFPLLTYPYVSRVLGVSNIGICNFVDSIIQYFILFSTLGIVSVGIREIAGCRNNQGKLNKTFTNLVVFNGIATLIAIFLCIIAIYSVPQLYEHKELMWIGVSKLLGQFFLIEWLYKGLEEFKYITRRTILVKIAYIISVFLFVKDTDDYDIYYVLLSLMVIFNAIFNVWHAKKFVHLSFSNLEITKYAKPIFVLGFYTILTSMYTTFNVTYLGFVCTKSEVGCYTTATKLHSIVIALYTAFTGVMLPRMSNLLNEGKKEEFHRMVDKSVNILVTMAIPLLIICIIFSPDIILVLSGKGYEGAIVPTMIVMPLLLVIGYNQINIVQIMTPLKAENFILRNSILGAFTGITLNIILVPKLGAIGSAITWVCSELIIMTASYICVKKLTGMTFPLLAIKRNIIAYIPGFIIAFLLFKYLNTLPVLRLLIACILIAIYFIIVQCFYLKDEMIMSYIGKIKNKIKR